MNKNLLLNGFLLLASLISGIVLIGVRTQEREVFRESETQRNIAKELQKDREELLIRQAELSGAEKVRRLAQQRGMSIASGERILDADEILRAYRNAD